jgi:hypothetical protein
MKHMKDSTLKNYVVTATDMQHIAGLEPPLAVKVFSREIATQKLEYIPARQVIQAGI